MSENAYSKTPKSFLWREDWLALLTGGLVSTGAVGWLVYRNFKSQQIDRKEIMTIAAFFAGGMGSSLIYMWGKSDVKQVKSTLKKGASDFTDQDDYAVVCKQFVNIVSELERKFAATMAMVCKCSDKSSCMNKIQEAAEVPCKSADMSKRLIDSDRKGLGNDLKLKSDNQKQTCINEDKGNRIAKFREFFSSISELKGYVQGIIDSLPSERNIHFVSTEMGDEIRRQVVTIVKEYANSILPKLEETVDKIVDSVSKAVEDLCYDKDHKVNKAVETLGVSEKYLSAELLKLEMAQYYNALEKATNKSRLSTSQKDQRCENAVGANMQQLESVTKPSLLEKNRGVLTKTPKHSLRALPKLHIPSSSGISFISKEANKPGYPGVEMLKNPQSKLNLSQEQMHYLNILKSEL